MEKVLVIGSGGREHAICDALKRSDEVSKVYCAPGNAGIAKIAECLPIKETDVEALCAFALDKDLALTVVGPEVALAAGVVDRFKKAGLRIFGPNKAAAMIESSKEFAKELMKKYDIPTAAFETFEEYEPAMEYVRKGTLPAVLKYDGLAAGKGVVIAETYEEADEALKDMLLNDKFGKGKVVIEDFLDGPEFSFMCFVDRDNVYPMQLSQDHKRAYDNDKGPNTGGMGAYSPVPFITKEDEEYAMNEIMIPTAKAMIAEGAPYSGVLYGGLIKTSNGIKVIEFNARFGDPETEIVLPRLKSDIYNIFCAIADGKKAEIEWHDFATLGIVLASKGYPGDYEKGAIIKGMESVKAKAYHMGTAQEGRNLVTAGGRVMIVVGKGATLKEAQEDALAEVEKIECDNLFHRTDIGHWAIKIDIK
ncbi:MAG: phosphoribosylamine--glycine ligase [Rikenellaceae bacterium]